MNFGMLGNSAAAYLATPDGQENIKKFLSSPDGIALLKNYLASPEGAAVVQTILPSVIGNLNLPAGTQETVQKLLQNR